MSETLSKSFEPAQIEQRWYPAWENSNAFRMGESREAVEAFCTLLPPPNVTGTLHMGHGFNQTLMDCLTRYHRMRGFDTLWQPGTDHAGIATQLVVERQLEQQGTSREQLGRSAFLDKVWQWKKVSGDTITRQMRRLGTSPDWQRERFTMDEGLSVTVTQCFVQLFRQGLIYRGKRLVNWDPSLLTAVSDLEVVMEEREGKMWYILYPFSDGEIDGMKGMHIATTRPETMLADGALAVHPEDPRYQHLIGKMVDLPLCNRQIPIIADDFVDREFASGCVKITGAHDFNDYACAKRHDLPLINIFTANAKINENGPIAYQGLDRYECRKAVLADLANQGYLEKEVAHKNMVPVGERSGVVIEPMLTNQWFVAMSKPTENGKSITEQALECVTNQQIKFYPDNWVNTYNQWLNNIQDWCISRQLWWGHQIPAWYSEDGQIFVAHDEAEAIQIAAAAGVNTPLSRDNDVLDTWFSSALWPFSTLDWTAEYPQQTNPALQRYLPSSVLVTGFDIIFFWVARMVIMTKHFTGKIPFRDVYVHGLIRDAQGQKMSKSKGNVLDPIDLIDGISLEDLLEKRTKGLINPKQAEQITKQTKKEFPNGIAAYGTDALRFTYVSLASPGRDIKFDLNRCEGYRNFCNKLWNASRFVLMHCEGFDLTVAASPEHLSIADRWIISALQRCEQQLEQHIADYRFDLLAQTLYKFVWDEFCDWYIEITKVNLQNVDEQLAYASRRTMILVLEAILRLLHPLIPFITEELWQIIAPLVGKKSQPFIMLAAYPRCQSEKIDVLAEAEILLLKQIVDAGRNLRSEMLISPAQKVPLWLELNDDQQQRKQINRLQAYLVALVKLSEIKIVNALPSDSHAPTAAIGNLRIMLEVTIDAAAERERLSKEIDKLIKQIDISRTKLAAASFVEKAPPAVVNQEKERLQMAEKNITQLKEQLASLPKS